MKILVISSSPKKLNSITYHHIKYLEKQSESHEFEYCHILGNTFEENYENTFMRMLKSDLILFTYPVYNMSIPYTLMLFMKRLLKDDRRDELKGKSVFQFSTSIHYLDVIACQYMRRCFESLNFNELPEYMANMSDLLHEAKRERMLLFFNKNLVRLDKALFLEKIHNEKFHNPIPFKYDMLTTGHKEKAAVTIIYNGSEASDKLKQMINAFDNLLGFQSFLLDISHFKLDGSCLACLNCTQSSTCSYNDDFKELYESRLETSSVIVYASDLSGHWLDSSFKLLDDRSFIYRHKNNLSPKGQVYLLNGSLKDEDTLEKYMTTRRLSKRHVHLGYASNDSEDILETIKNIVLNVEDYLKEPYYSSASFYSEACQKIYRDTIYQQRGFMPNDHNFLKANNLYNFPKKGYIKNFFFLLLYRLSKNTKREKKFFKLLSNRMLKSYKDVLKE